MRVRIKRRNNMGRERSEDSLREAEMGDLFDDDLGHAGP